MEQTRKSRLAIAAPAAGLVLALVGILLLFGDDDGGFRAPPPPAAGARSADAPRVTFDAPPPPDSEPGTEVAPTVPPAPDDASRPAPSARETEQEEDRRPATVVGRVVDRAGVGVPQAKVRLAQVRRRGRGEVEELEADALGAFRAELPPGTWSLTARKPGLVQGDLEWVRLGPGEAREVELVLRPATALRGQVLSQDGHPLADARVEVRPEGRQRASTELEADGDGRFLADGLAEGLYTVTADLDGYVRQTERSVPVTEESGGEVTFRLAPAGQLAGLLRTQAGGPLARGLVFAFWGGDRLGMTRSDEAGRYQLELRPGPVELFVRSDDYALATRLRAEVGAGQLTPLDVVLAEGARIEGSLRDPSGQPRAGLRVVAREVNGDVVRRSEESDAEGRFKVENLYPGTYELTVGGGRRGDGALLRETVEVTSGPLDRDLVVPDGAEVTGVVEDPAGKPVEGANVFAIAEGEARAATRSRKDGGFRLVRLPAGDYRLLVRVGDDRQVGSRAVTLAEGAVLEDLHVLVAPPARLRGRVVGPGGAGVAGVVLQVRGGDAPVFRRATTDADGRYELGPLYDGEYALTASDGPLRLLAAKWEVEAARVEPFAFRIAQGRDVTRDLVVETTP